MKATTSSLDMSLPVAEGITGTKMLFPSEVRTEAQPVELDNYSVYPIKWRIDSGSHSFFSIALRIINTFDVEQKSVILRSIRLWQARQFPDDRRVRNLADRYPRNNSVAFNGRLYSASDLSVVSGRNGESIAINLASYESLYIYDYDEDDKDDRDGVEAMNVYVDRFDEGPSADGVWTLGRAELNYYSNHGREQRISLNGNALGPDSDYVHRLDRLVWAAAIKHELLHNLGWDHGTFGSDDFSKSWMVVYTDCMVSPLLGPFDAM